MAFDQTTRNRLARFVGDARALLTEEFTRQLQHEYGLDPVSGAVTDLDRLTALDDPHRETARILRETMDYYLAALNPSSESRGESVKEVLDRIVREQAFTVLNRLCALHMAEARGLLIESVGRGYQSRGFQLYARLAGPALGETGETYRSYLYSLLDEFAVDLPVLFDRFSPEGRLFPRETTLLKLLEMINDPEIEPLWAEDETIGWIYQYFNSVEERKQMRAESSSPRNSRELAVRNQFFTPRYVVEFLTDNTLGRIWYEMTKGETALKETCRYLVRHPSEIFLKEREEAPTQEQPEADLSKEELLRQPVYVPHRPLKDPREIKMLDPACGSMHFGLYAFDLFELIYAEAWELEAKLGANTVQRVADLDSLHDTYPDKETFLRDVPRLIIERNIHGIDIDPRAVQIAGLSLWLRAQKSWQAQGLKQHERPQITKSNIVCAEPMPGDQQMLEEFLSTLQEDRLEALMQRVLHLPPGRRMRSTKAMANALAILVRKIWLEMELAGEAGSLLKIEETISASIDQARNASEEKAPLFQVLEFGMEYQTDGDKRTSIAVEGEDFWSHADALVLSALQEYMEHAENGGEYRRSLFAEDAKQGFAFIDLCRKQYDVVIMNPPFGLPTNSSKEYIFEFYQLSKEELLTAFLTRSSDFLIFGGLVGCIGNRTIFYLANHETWRLSFFENFNLQILLDLGFNVLDALVEVACHISEKTNRVSSSLFFRCLSAIDKEAHLGKILNLSEKEEIRDFFIKSIDEFRIIPRFRFSYSSPHFYAKSLQRLETLIGMGYEVYVGAQTSDNFRFIRLAWEIPISEQKSWIHYAKGGEYKPYWGDIHLRINWQDEGREVKEWASSLYGGRGHWSRIIHHPDRYFTSGFTYSRRTASSFNPRVLPRNCIFGEQGPAIQRISPESADHLAMLAILNSRIFKMFVEFNVAAGDASTSGTAARTYERGVIGSIPVPHINKTDEVLLNNLTSRCINNAITLDKQNETSQLFDGNYFMENSNLSIQGIAEKVLLENENLFLEVISVYEETERIIVSYYNLTQEDITFLDEEIGVLPTSLPRRINIEDELIQIWNNSEEQLIQSIKKDGGRARSIIGKYYIIDRLVELFGIKLKTSPESIISIRRKLDLNKPSILDTITKTIISYAFGSSLGRWDFRLEANKNLKSLHSDLFSPLPFCPPGMLQNSEGLPASLHDVPIDYPLRISWEGILVDDEKHIEDIEQRVRDSLNVIYHNHTEFIEQEACQILRVRSLREYFRKPTGFFADHLKRYSKSRRSAPIYWPLSTPSNSYTLWLYYHRLSDQILFTCVNDFVDPKLKQISEEAARLSLMKDRTNSDEKELERLTDLEVELKDFRTELLRVAAFWKPNLNDGVQITAAPLLKLFQHKIWQKRLKETWRKLEKGEYDWAHLAYSIWPERVREKCKTDMSLAIAHDLEHLYEEPKAPLKKKKGKKRKEAEMEDIFDE